MPAARRSLTPDDVHRFVREHCFPPGATGSVGVELEWLTVANGDISAPVAFDVVRGALDAMPPLPGGSRITWEPGGQVELSGPPIVGVSGAVTAMQGDVDTIRTALDPCGIDLVGFGRHPTRKGARVLELPRYQAMQAYFDALGPYGRVMMLSTAAVQVNLDMGDVDAVAARWRLAHDLGPVVAAACANSPFVDGTPSGFRSSRLATWGRVDPSRSEPPSLDGDPADEWARYVLRSHVMLVRASETRYVPVTSPLPLAQWIAEGTELGYPTLDDLAYHLTTLFPPVRPRGWLEIRTVDALPFGWWPVPVAVATALLDDDAAANEAGRALAGCAPLWAEACDGMSHSRLGEAATKAFAIALEALPRVGATPDLVDLVARFADGYVDRGRCPADDLLDAWARDGSVRPADSPVPVSWS